MVPSSPRGGDASGPRASVDDANDERNSRKRVDLLLSATTTTTDPSDVDAASTRDDNSSAKKNNDSSSPATRKDSGSASSSGRSDGCDRRRGGGGGEDVEEEERKQQQELLLLEEESGRRSKRASIDVGDESTLERYRRIGMQQKQKQEEEEKEEEEEGVELVEEQEDEEKQISSAKISERIKALLAQTKDEMNDKRDEDYDEAEDDMYNTCVYGEYERGGERDDEKEEENDAIYETIVEEEENLSELSSKYSEQMREVFIKAKNAEAMEKKKGKAAFLSKKAAGEDDVKAFPASAEEGKKKMKMKKKGFLSGIFSSKSKKVLSSAAELEGKDE